jgi:hypothetical protein
MNRPARKLTMFLAALLILRAPRLFAQPSPAAVAAFNTYAHTVESRLAQQHRSPDNFLALDPAARARLRSGELLIEKISTPATPGALLHHWRATAFVPNIALPGDPKGRWGGNIGVPGDPKGRWGGNIGVPGDPKGRWGGNPTAAAFEHLLQNFSAYPQNFAPEILSSTVLSRSPTGTLLRLRTRQHHVITVVLDTTCDVTFAALDATHGYSISRSTRIDQITPTGDNGFLYRLNTYWTWEQRDGGLYLQLESLSLTRSIPRGLAWAVQPYLESIPRESLVFTLTSARNALQKTGN